MVISLGFSPLYIDFVDSASRCSDNPLVVTDGEDIAVIYNDQKTCSADATIARIAVKLEGTQIWNGGNATGPDEGDYSKE